MPSRLITLLLVPLVVVVAACGSEPTQTADSNSDVSQLLRDTFSNLSKMKSADVGLQLRLDSPAAQGPVSAEVTGPFATTGEGKLPRFAFNATLSAGGRSQRLGATWTGEKAFITVQNTAYAVSDLVARQFTAGYQQALRSKQGKQAKGGLLLSSLGIDFTKWLKNAQNAGTAQVGDAQTVRITGQADIPQMVGDLGRITQRAQSLGVTGGSQAQLTPQQKQQLEQAIKSVDVQIYTGAQDRILRRLVLHAVLHDPQAKGESTLDLDLQFTKVNQDQQISAPANPKPFSELLKATGALNGGGLSGLLGGVHVGGASSGSGSAPSGSNVDRYAQCVKKANGDATKSRKCAALLTG